MKTVLIIYEVEEYDEELQRYIRSETVKVVSMRDQLAEWLVRIDKVNAFSRLSPLLHEIEDLKGRILVQNSIKDISILEKEK